MTGTSTRVLWRLDDLKVHDSLRMCVQNALDFSRCHGSKSVIKSSKRVGTGEK